MKLIADTGAVAVECPTCGARVGWACGAAHCDGSHRTRIRRALLALGRVERRGLRHTFGQPFFFDLREGRYYDAVPGYRSLFVRRLDRRDAAVAIIRLSVHETRAPRGSLS